MAGGFLARIFGRTEKRNFGEGFLPGIFGDYGGGFSAGGGYYPPRVAENIATVVACVSAICNPISSVPARVYRTIPGGREEAPDHPVSRLIRAPNERQTWPDLITFVLGQALLHGNAIIVIERDRDGVPVQLVPVPWYAVSPQIMGSGRLAFDVVMPIFLFGGTTGQSHRYFAEDIFWLRERSDDGYLGRSVLHRAPAVLRAALGIQQFTSTLWDNVATPSGVLKTDAKLTKEAREALSAQFQATFTGARNSGKVPVLEQGLSFEAMAMTPEDSEVLASRRFTGEEICRLFGVPPPIAGDFQFGSFTNAETAGRWHSSLCLSIWCRRIEAEFQRSVFGAESDFHLLIDLSGLQRGDDAARWQTYALARANNILTIDEIRKAEGYNPLSAETGEVVPGSEAG